MMGQFSEKFGSIKRLVHHFSVDSMVLDPVEQRFGKKNHNLRHRSPPLDPEDVKFSKES